MRAPTITVWRDEESLAEAIAARLITGMVATQAGRGRVSVVLTGGGIGIATLEAVARSPARERLDWSAVEIWWTDERFTAPDHPDRNEGQARRALLDHVALDPTRVHPMPAVGSPAAGPDGTDVHAAAAGYADELARHAAPQAHPPVPPMDVLLLGLGEDGHVASLFPRSPALDDTRSVVGVQGAPKPPPQRISLTLPAIRAAEEVWVIAAGERKASAVQQALGDADPRSVPARAVRGRAGTFWLLDRAAAALVPRGLVRPASS